jgi:hypothetical protein
MANKPDIADILARRQPQTQDRSADDAYRKAIEVLFIDNNLWRQIDRWVNEGGAVSDGNAPSQPKKGRDGTLIRSSDQHARSKRK